MASLQPDDVLNLKFYDEVGADRRNLYPKVGRAKRGTQPQLAVNFKGWRQHYTSGALMSLSNMPPIWDVRAGGFKGDDVVDFFLDLGFPSCTPGTTIIMDNVSTHHYEWGEKILAAADFLDISIKFLPAYCPEWNPIELLFSKLKYKLRRVTTKSIFFGFADAYASVTQEDCLGWAQSCGYKVY
mmetsp:Transcript_33149/g.77750  ORF Transcript_33149/g.77750 Transcript_33149/m.77750 type:complete len:184 (+) Transcript_33149:1-552(+)